MSSSSLTWEKCGSLFFFPPAETPEFTRNLMQESNPPPPLFPFLSPFLNKFAPFPVPLFFNQKMGFSFFYDSAFWS